MRYVLKLEAIGDNYAAYLRHWNKSDSKQFGYRELQAIKLGRRELQPWCALIVSVAPSGKLLREFVNGQKDYSFANSVGSRGIFFYYALKPGIYEINEPLSWKRHRRYFARVVDDNILAEITEQEVRDCLKNKFLDQSSED